MKKLLFPLSIASLIISSFGDINAQTRKVLVEEGTGTWCQFCPRGKVYGDSLVKTNANAIVVAVHNNDPMENSTYDQASAFAGLPSAHINRGLKNRQTSNWFSDVQAQMAITPPAAVYVTNNYNSSSGSLDVTVSAKFSQALSGDYRFAAIVVEDGIVGDNQAYNQVNAFSGGGHGPMGGFENLPTPVPYTQIMYNHVGRDLLGGYDGQAGSLPATISNGDSLSYTFNFNVPASYDPEYVHIVGLLIENSSGEILNAEMSEYLTGLTNAKPKFLSPPNTAGFENAPYEYKIFARDPDNQSLTISASGLPSWLSLADGGKGNATLSGIPLSVGTYPITLSVSDGQWQKDQTFDVVVTVGSGILWGDVGTDGYASNVAVEGRFSVATDMTGNMYAAYVVDGSQNIEFKKLDANGQWASYASTISKTARDMTMVTGNGGLYVMYSEAGANWTNINLQVTHYDGTAWNGVGSIIETGNTREASMAIHNGELYVLYMSDPSGNGTLKMVKYDGTNWVQVGSDIAAPAGRGDIAFNSQGNPIVNYVEFAGNPPFDAFVKEYDGTDWNQLGGTLGSPAFTTGDVCKIATDVNDNVYFSILTYPDEEINAKMWDGSQWSDIGTNIANGNAKWINLAVNKQNEPIVLYDDLLGGGEASALIYSNGNWQSLGVKGFSDGIAESPKLIIAEPYGTPVAAYKNASQNDRLHIMSYGPYTIGQEESIVKNDLIEFYPNPLSGNKLYLSDDDLNGKEYSLYNLQGQVVVKGLVANRTIKMNNIPEGMYVLNVNNQSGKLSIVR